MPEQGRLMERVLGMVFMASLGTLVLLAVTSQMGPRRTTTSTMDFITESQSMEELRVQFETAYSKQYHEVGKGYPWLTNAHLVEQHRSTTMRILGHLSDHRYRWQIKHAEEDLPVGASGPAIRHTFAKAGRHEVTISEHPTEYFRGSKSTRTATTHVVCKYVRRELRKLSDSDRQNLLSAMRIVYSVREDEGQSLYGSKFHDISYFAEMHNTLSGNPDCDHLHDGLGFLLSHAAFSLEFEQALQAVTPSVALPFWDFTIDAETIRLNHGDFSLFYESPIFSDKWFGGMRQGPFANISCDAGFWNRTSRVKNAYGFIRSPWNTNHVPFVTRSNTTFGFEVDIIPDCSDHYKLMQYSAWAKFGMDSQYLPHGPIHTLIGGTFGGDDWRRRLDDLDYDMSEGQKWAIRSFGASKDMWRQGVLSCPQSCSSDAPPSSCKCTCPNITDWLATGKASSILSTYVHPRFSNEKLLRNKHGDDVSEDILRLFCNDDESLWPVIGDSLASSSAIDPTFWVMHTTSDRLFHWRRIQGFEDERWDDHTYVHTDDGICWGHQEHDAMVWTNLFDTSNHHYTQAELYTLLDPLTDTSLPYVYDNFEWPHCQSQGFPLHLLE